MTDSVFLTPQYNLTYDPFFINTMMTVATQRVNAFQSEDGTKFNLTLGGSSNVDIEAVDSIRMYFDDRIQLFNTSVSNSIRTDSNIMNIYHSNTTSYLTAPTQKLSLSGTDSAFTTTVAKTTLNDSNDYQLLSTTDINGFAFAQQAVFNSNVIVNSDLTAKENIALSGNCFSSTMNLYRNINPTTENSNHNQTAYGFYINEYDQLEVVKYDKFGSNGGTQTHSIKKVVTFGNTQGNTIMSDPQNYTVLNEFNGLAVSSNGVTVGLTPIAWTANADKERIYFDTSNVGINTTDPQYWLDVNGDLFVSDNIMCMSFIGAGTSNPEYPLHVVGTSYFNGDIIPAGNGIYNLGSATNRFNTLYVSANTIDIGGALISYDSNTGGLNVANDLGLGPVNAKSLRVVNDSNTFVIQGDASAGTLGVYEEVGNNLVPITFVPNLYSIGSNVGISKSNPSYALDVLGEINASSNVRTSSLYISNGSNTYLMKDDSSNSLGFYKLVDNVPQAITLLPNIYTSGSNVGISKTVPTVALDITGKVKASSSIAINSASDNGYSLYVNGPIYATSYSNLLINSYTSGSTSNAPTSAALSNAFGGFINKSSNLSDLSNKTTALNNLGIGSSCNVTFSNITTNGSIIPSVTQVASLGTSNYRFKEAWVDELHLAINTLYLGDTPVIGTNQNTVLVKADVNQGVNILTSGTGRTQLTSAMGIDMTVTNGGMIGTFSNGDIQYSTTGTNRTISMTSTGVNSRVALAADTEVNISSSNTTINGNSTITGNLTVDGDLTVSGSNFIANVTTVQIEDNILLLNRGQVGSGVSSSSGSGIEIDRGDLAKYRLVFKETSQMFEMGAVGAELPLATQSYASSYVNTNTFWKSSNLGDVSSASVARTNLGLGSTNNVTFSNVNFTGTLDGPSFNNTSNYLYSLTPTQWQNSSSNVYLLNSNVGIGVSNPSYKLHVGGNIYATGDITGFSDARKKYNITTITDALDKVKQISGYTFNVRDSEMNKRYTGVIAQEIEQVLPEVVYEDSVGYKSVAYGNIVGLLIESIKELSSRVDMLIKA